MGERVFYWALNSRALWVSIALGMVGITSFWLIEAGAECWVFIFACNGFLCFCSGFNVGSISWRNAAHRAIELYRGERARVFHHTVNASFTELPMNYPHEKRDPS